MNVQGFREVDLRSAHRLARCSADLGAGQLSVGLYLSVQSAGALHGCTLVGHWRISTKVAGSPIFGPIVATRSQRWYGPGMAPREARPTDAELRELAKAQGVDPSADRWDLIRVLRPMPPEPHADQVARFRRVRQEKYGRVTANRRRSEILCEMRIGEGPWWVLGVFRLHMHRLVLTELKVFPGGMKRWRDPKAGKWEGQRPAAWSGDLDDVPPGGIPYRILREIRPSELADFVYAEADRLCRLVPIWWAMDLMYSLPAEPDESSDRPANTLGTPEVELARLAARWVQKVQAGSRKPNAEIAAEDGMRTEQVRDRIHRAREKGLLSGGHAGRVDGGLTDRARRLLAGADWDVWGEDQ